MTDADFKLRSVAVVAFGPTLLFGIAEGAMLPIVALSAIDRGASVPVASLVASLVGIGSLIANIPAGWLASRLGERRAILVAAVVAMIGLGLTIAPLGLAPFSLGVLLFGGASAVFYLARQSFLTEVVPIGMRARALSTLGGSMRIGVFLGPFIGAAAMHWLGLAGAYVLALAAVVGSGVIAWFMPELELAHRAAASVTTRSMLRDHWRVFVTLGAAVVMIAAIRQSRQVVIPLWSEHVGLNAVQTSLIYGLSGALDAAVFYPAGKVMDRRGVGAVAIPSMVALAVTFLFLPLTSGFWTVGVVAMLMGVANGIGSGIVMTLGANASPREARPTFLGLWRELSDLGSSLGPVLLSVVTALAGLGVGIVVSGIVGFGAAAALWRWLPRPRRRETG